MKDRMTDWYRTHENAINDAMDALLIAAIGFGWGVLTMVWYGI